MLWPTTRPLPRARAGTWVSEYPAPYGDHSKSEALASLAAVGARVVTVQSLYSSQPDLNAVVSTQMKEIAEETGAVVPLCAFKTSATTWKCGAFTCCDGTILTGGDCILRYGINENGTGFSGAVVDGLSNLVAYTTMDVYAEDRDDGDPGTPDTTLFLTSIEANAPDDRFKPPAEPERSCAPVPTPAPFNGAPHNNGYLGFAQGTRSVGQPGARLLFTVRGQNLIVPETSELQAFTVFIDIIDDVTGGVLDTVAVPIVVPPAPLTERAANF